MILQNLISKGIELKKKKIQDKMNIYKPYFNNLHQIDKKLFKNCCFMFNGVYGENFLYSEYHLTKLSVEFGAIVTKRFSTKSITHMICKNLPTLYKTNNSIKYVKPEWIIDSIKEGKLLNFEKYKIIL
jgi:hypothetical protein